MLYFSIFQHLKNPVVDRFSLNLRQPQGFSINLLILNLCKIILHKYAVCRHFCCKRVVNRFIMFCKMIQYLSPTSIS
nr:MAG TPA: hypothetical protein [Caudoviricetes sp.]